MKTHIMSLILKVILSAVLILICSLNIKAQSWLPIFKVRFGYSPIDMSGKSLNEFLQNGFPLVAKGCDTKVCLFYFRVNGNGDVDSLYYEGNFNKEECTIITNNILNTKGNWITPKNTNRTDFCWFVYPCYILGKIVDPCLDDPKNQQQIALLRNLLNNYSNTFDKQGRFLLSPNNYSYYDKK